MRGIRILKAVSSSVRLQILNFLFDKGALSYTELMNLLKMSPSRDAGRFAYHLKFLLKADLLEVDADSKKYSLTDLGKMVCEVAEEIEKKGLGPHRILVRTSRLTLEEFDVNKIVDSLVKEADMPVENAKKVAKEAEKRLLKARTRYLTAPLIREVVNGILVEKGLEEYRHKLTRLGLPVHDVSHILSRGKAFCNASFLCEEFGKNVFEEYTLLNVLPRDIADAHLSGEIHINGLGCWILMPSEAVHDLRFFLKGVGGFHFSQLPPNNLESALNYAFNVLLFSAKEICEMQVLEYFNVFLAPFLRSVDTVKAKEALKRFIFNVGQHVRASLNLELTVPDFLADKPAVGASLVSGTYGDYIDECQHLAMLVMEVLAEGSLHKPMLNPKVVVKMRPDAFKDGEAVNVLLNAHRLASEKGTPYFANIGETGWHSVFSPSGFKLKADLKSDWEVDTLRTGALGVVTVNLPRIAYECNNDKSKFFQLLRERLEMAVNALEIKFRMLKQRSKVLLRFMMQAANDDQYFRLENSARLVNLAGLEESVKAFNGKSFYEDEGSLKFASEIANYVSDFLHKGDRRGERRLVPSVLPSSEASVRLTRQDIERYGVAKVVFHGTREKPYYSSFKSLNVENSEALLKVLAIEKELRANLAGGSLHVLELGEAEYTPENLFSLTKFLVEKCEVELFTYNRCLTYCSQCDKSMFGMLHKCPNCGSVGTLKVFRRCL
ncbi:MAG: anaerobic ribonucleoside-triphosphate reductase [Candidatus Bathyarchaeia archaeon]